MWQPSARLDVLRQRAQTFAGIRAFFSQREVLEIDVPVMGATTVTDPHLASLSLDYAGRQHYLQTSPEFFLKRALASGLPSLYCLGKVFRKDEVGKRHSPEFTMLEWYQLDWDDRALSRQVVELIQSFCPTVQPLYRSYAELFSTATGVDPHRASIAELADVARQRLDIDWPNEPRNTWLDLLFTHLVEPTLGDDLVVVADYPASQAALAKTAIDGSGVEVARRFEVYWRGIELANGYWELTDPAIQRRRFADDIEARRSMLNTDSSIVIDQKFLAALDHGLPECAGVALGVDRLLMCLLNEKDIRNVMPFSFDRL